MILENVSKHIILNAGHHDNDSGAVSGQYIERDMCKKVRDEMIPLLERAGFSFTIIPDSLTLVQSIAEANRMAPTLQSGLCLDVHFNYSSDPKVNGAEGYYGTSETSQQIAATLSLNIGAELGIKDRGARPDTSTAVGSLGWIRQTKAWAILVEVAYISNAGDMAAVEGVGYRLAALGIVNGLCEVFGMPKISLVTHEEVKKNVNKALAAIDAELDEIRESIDNL